MLMVMLSPRDLFLVSHSVSEEECHEIAKFLASASDGCLIDGNPSFIDKGGRVSNWRKFSGIRFGRKFRTGMKEK